MQLRRFTADSTPAALGAVRLALGDDAIILANRRQGDQVEIIATGQFEDVSSLTESALNDAVEKATVSTPEDTLSDRAGNKLADNTEVSIARQSPLSRSNSVAITEAANSAKTAADLQH